MSPKVWKKTCSGFVWVWEGVRDGRDLMRTVGDLTLKVWDLPLKVWDLTMKVLDLTLKVWDLTMKVLDLTLRKLLGQINAKKGSEIEILRVLTTFSLSE